MTPTRTILLALAAGLLGCQTGDLAPETTSRPLIGGDIHTGDLAAVALTINGNPFCTGTLVSPSVVATAAHCIDMAGSDPSITVFFGEDTTSNGTKIGVKLAAAHPGWTGSLADQHDIGLMLMNFPFEDPFLPVPLNTSPIGDHVGDPVRRIGFGIYDRATGDADGKKREGTTVIHTVPPVGDYFYAGDEELSTCNGDSGGPVLLTVQGVEYLAGVHSFGFDSGDERCVPPNNGDTRVDVYVDDFVRPWIDANDPTCGSDGLCAPIGCSDDPDCQPCGADGTCTTDCPLPDPDCPTSAVGEICQADSQCMTGICVFWAGDPGTKFCTRECDPAAGDCPTA